MKEQQKTPTEVVQKPPEANVWQGALAGLTPEDQAQLAPIIKSIQSTYEGSIASNDQTTKALLQGGTIDGMEIQGIQPAFKSIQDELSGLKTNLLSSTKILQDIATEARDANKAYLDQEKQAEQERLANDKVRMQRELSRQKFDAHQALVVQLALAGGFGQDATMAEVRESDAHFEQTMRDLESEFSTKNTELTAKFSALYVQNTNEYAAKSSQNIKDLQEGLENIGLQSISSQQAKMTAEQNLMINGWENEVSIRKELANKNLEIAKDMVSMANAERNRKFQEKKDSVANLFNAFSQSTDPEFRKWAIKQAQIAGVTGLENIDPASLTASQLENQQKGMADNLLSEYRGKFKDEDTGWDLTTVLRNSAADMKSDKRYSDAIADGIAALQRGDYKQFARDVLSNSKISMDADTASNVNARIDIYKAFDGVQSELNKLSPDDYGTFFSKFQKGKAFFEGDIDQKFVALRARIQAAQTVVKNKLLGANMTEQELEFANDFLINFKGDEVETMLTKMKQLREGSRSFIETRVDGQAGDGIYKNIIEKYLPSEGMDSMEGSLEGDAGNEWLEKGWKNQKPISADIGGRKVLGHGEAISMLQKADEDFFESTGKHLFVNSSYRSSEQQKKAYERYQKGEIALAAPPGKSLHEHGIAFDITNWREAEPFLVKYGFHPLPKNLRSRDPGHFSYKVIG